MSTRTSGAGAGWAWTSPTPLRSSASATIGFHVLRGDALWAAGAVISIRMFGGSAAEPTVLAPSRATLTAEAATAIRVRNLRSRDQRPRSAQIPATVITAVSMLVRVKSGPCSLAREWLAPYAGINHPDRRCYVHVGMITGVTRRVFPLG